MLSETNPQFWHQYHIWISVLTFGSEVKWNPSILVHLTIPKSQHHMIIHSISINDYNKLNSTVLRFASNCILLDLDPIPCPILLSFYYTSHSICTYILVLPTIYHKFCLQFKYHGTFNQSGDEFLLTKQSRSAPSKSISTRIQQDSWASFVIISLTSNHISEYWVAYDIFWWVSINEAERWRYHLGDWWWPKSE